MDRKFGRLRHPQHDHQLPMRILGPPNKQRAVRPQLGLKFGKPLPGIMWDGIVDAKSGGSHNEMDALICIRNNGDVKFLNYDAAGGFKKVSGDLKTAIPCSSASSSTTLGGLMFRAKIRHGMRCLKSSRNRCRLSASGSDFR